MKDPLFRNNRIQRKIRKGNQFLGTAIASDLFLVSNKFGDVRGTTERVTFLWKTNN